MEKEKELDEEVEEVELEDVEEEIDEEDESESIEEITDRLLRLQADFVNYRNRAEKDKLNTVAYATEDLVNQILPILDNFERALGTGDKDDSFYKGVKLIYDQLVQVLEKNGLEEIKCLGKCFDPNYHHGVLVEEAEADEEAGTVIDVLQKGYTLKGKVIRPTMVKVAE